MKQFTLICLILLFFTACSSLDSDAKKAAELNNKSLEYIKKQDLQEAEELYKEAQEIITEYKDSDKKDEFFTKYYEYLTEGIN